MSKLGDALEKLPTRQTSKRIDEADWPEIKAALDRGVSTHNVYETLKRLGRPHHKSLQSFRHFIWLRTRNGKRENTP